MFTDDLFGGRPPAPGGSRRNPTDDLAESVHLADKVGRHIKDGTIHLTPEERAAWNRQADWEESDGDAPSFIRGKPDLGKKQDVLYTSSAGWEFEAQTADVEAFLSGNPGVGVDFNAGANYYVLTGYDSSRWYVPPLFHAGEVSGSLDFLVKTGENGTDLGYLYASPTVERTGVPAEVDPEPAVGSRKLVLSGGVQKAIAEAVSAIRDSAPAAFDTLKEIADWIGGPGSGAQAVINQVSGKADKVANATTGNFAGLNASGNLTDSGKKESDFATAEQGAKADSALQAHQQLVPIYGGNGQSHTPWTVLREGVDVTAQVGQPEYNPSDAGHGGNSSWHFGVVSTDDFAIPIMGGEDATSFSWTTTLMDDGSVSVSYSASRTANPLLGYILGAQTDKPLQPKGDYQPALTAAQIANIAAVPNKANSSDVTAALALKADASSLPYALVNVTPTAGAPFVLAACFPISYEFDTTYTDTDMEHARLTWDEASGKWIFQSQTVNLEASPPLYESICSFNSDGTFYEALADNLTFGDPATPPTGSTQVLGFTPTAQLTDRAVNKVTLGSGVERAVFKFPAKTQGKARDFMLRLVITGSTVPEIGFVESDGTTEVAFDADDDSWADIEQGVNILMFTDTQEASA